MATGDKIYDLGLTKVGSPYRLGVLVPKNDPHWNGAYDCSEFASWLLYQVTNKLYGCVNDNGNPATADAWTGFWKRDADTIGKAITVEQAAKIKGAFVLRYSGSGLIGHIVVSDGAGGTVEAHSSRDGVIASTLNNRRWDIGIVPPFVDYTVGGDMPVVKPVETIYRWTTPLMRGDKVKEIQNTLQRFGIRLSVDGIYGSQTFYAVREFQDRKGLNPDGEVGLITAKALGIQL